eukprot:6936204-Prymnesium_polylepis.1
MSVCRSWTSLHRCNGNASSCTYPTPPCALQAGILGAAAWPDHGQLCGMFNEQQAEVRTGALWLAAKLHRPHVCRPLLDRPLLSRWHGRADRLSCRHEHDGARRALTAELHTMYAKAATSNARRDLCTHVQGLA